jgi:hypothetical protein
MKKHPGFKLTLSRETLRHLSSEETHAAGGRTVIVPTAGGNTCSPSCSPLFCPNPLPQPTFGFCPQPVTALCLA